MTHDDDELRSLFLRNRDAASTAADDPARRRAIDEILRGNSDPRCLEGRYELGPRLGAGAMGVVHEGVDRRLGRRVAIKRVRADARGPAIDKLRGEAEILAALSHPHIVTVHDVVVEADEVFVVMELLEGQSVRAWARRRRTWVEIVAVFTRAARGVAAAHGAGVIHRDIKASNIMVTADGGTKVIDFGLARGADGEPPPSTQDGEDKPVQGSGSWTRGVGTPPYMAPEQREGQTRPASDQYSLCASLYEVLTGDPPFATDRPVGVRSRADARRLRRGLATRRVPRWLRVVIVRGLAASPDDRFLSAEALAHALSQRRMPWRWPLMGFAVAGGAMLLTLPPDRCDVVERSASSSLARTSQVVGVLIDEHGLPVANEFDKQHREWLEQWQERAEAACRGGEATLRRFRCTQEGLETLDAYQSSLIERSVRPADPLQMRAELASVECKADRWAQLTAAAEVLDDVEPQLMPEVHALYVATLAGEVDDQIRRLESLIEPGRVPAALRPWLVARLANALLVWGEPERAAAVIEPLLADSAGYRDPVLRALVSMEAANALAQVAGREAEAENLAARAARAIESSARGVPHYPEVFGARAVAALAVGDAEAAQRAANRGLEALANSVRPRFAAGGTDSLRRAQLLHLRGQAREALGREQDALADYDQAAQIVSEVFPAHPDHARILSSLGVLRGRLGQYERADQVLQRSRELWLHTRRHSDAAGVAMNQGNLWLRAAQLGRARALYAEATALLPADASIELRSEVLYNGALADLLAEHYDAAIRRCSEVLHRTARSPAAVVDVRFGAYLVRAIAFVERDELERAHQDFYDARSMEPSWVGVSDALEVRLGLLLTAPGSEEAQVAEWTAEAQALLARGWPRTQPVEAQWAKRFQDQGRSWPLASPAPEGASG